MQRQDARDRQGQPASAETAGATMSRRDALATGAKVAAGGAALVAGLNAGFGQAPAVVRAASTITLRYMHWNTAFSTNPPWFKAILAGFTKLHPGVVVESNYVAFAQYLPTLTSMAAAKTLPDLFHAHVLAAQLGRAGLSINYRDHLPTSFLKQFYASPIRQFTFDGTKLYALPLNAQTFGLFYNRQIMGKLKLQPPETWDDLIAMTPAIRKAGLTPVSWGNALSNAGPDFLLPMVTQYGGDVYALDDLTKPGVSWNSKPVVEAFALLDRLQRAGAFPAAVNGITQDPQSAQMWYHGQAAMHWDGSWYPPVARAAAPKDFVPNIAVTKLPTVTRDGRHWTGDGSGEGVAISAHSPHRDLALAFVRYLFSPAVYDSFIKNSQNFPSIRSAQTMITDPLVRTMIGYLPDGTDHILFGNGSWNAVSNAVTAVLAGSLSPQAAAAQVQATVVKTRKGRH